MVWDVTVDYVTTTTVLVEAETEEAAYAEVERYWSTDAGADELLSMMCRNVPDGFDCPHIEHLGRAHAKPMLVAKGE